MIIELPNGSTLITSDNQEQRLVFIMQGLSFGAEMLPENEEYYGSEAWVNKEIDIYEQALEIDLKAHRDYLRDCLLNGILNSDV